MYVDADVACSEENDELEEGESMLTGNRGGGAMGKILSHVASKPFSLAS